MTLHAFITTLVLVQEVEEEVNEAKDLYPPLNELIVGAIAFGVLFFFTWKWVLPRLGKALEERRQRIQGSLEEAERARKEADEVLAKYEEKLQEARVEAGRIIDEARRTAEEARADVLARAEEEARQLVERAQQEAQGERLRAMQALRRDLAQASVELASRVLGESLDDERHLRLVERYIDEVGVMSGGNGNGQRGG